MQLKGLNFLKGREDPLALPEEDYPEWLWNILESGKKRGEEGKEEVGDEFCMSFSCFSSHFLPQSPEL